MKFRHSAPFLLIGVTSVIVTSMVFLSAAFMRALVSSADNKQFQLMSVAVSTRLHSTAVRALERAAMIAALPGSRVALAARDRQRLLAEYQTMFQEQKEEYGAAQMQFHLAPATSFLRLHAPDTLEEDLSATRPLVAAVNQSHVPQSGIEISSTGPLLFGVVPVQDMQGRYIGSFEVGLDIGRDLEIIKGSYGAEVALLIEEHALRQLATGLGRDTFSEERRVGQYVRWYATNWALLRQLVTDTNLTSGHEPVHYRRVAAGAHYGVQLVPLLDTSRQPIGIIAVARDFSASHTAEVRSAVLRISVIFCAIIILSGAILVILRGVLLRPLAVLLEKFAALADGDCTQTIAGTDSLCDELRALAECYERLRRRGSSGQGGGT